VIRYLVPQLLGVVGRGTRPGSKHILAWKVGKKLLNRRLPALSRMQLLGSMTS